MDSRRGVPARPGAQPSLAEITGSYRGRDLRHDVMDSHGRMRILPAEFWKATTTTERYLFGVQTGIYSFPTVELVDHVRGLIADRPAIEIGAGHGVLAEALGIPATDSRMQERTPWREHYASLGQRTAPYGDNVVKCEASEAVRLYRPSVVVACWVTHLYQQERHECGGSVVGVDEDDIVDHCDLYVLVGNEGVHYGKKIWDRPHSIVYPPWLYSRAINGGRDFIATWKSEKPK